MSVDPIRRDPSLDCWGGRWIAIKDGVVIADAESSTKLAPEVLALGTNGRGAVAQFVAPWSADIVIGLG